MTNAFGSKKQSVSKVVVRVVPDIKRLTAMEEERNIDILGAAFVFEVDEFFSKVVQRPPFALFANKIEAYFW